MNIGGPELLIILFIVVFVVFTIWAAVDAFRSGQTGWGIGILVAWVCGVGWLVALIYLATARGRSTA